MELLLNYRDLILILVRETLLMLKRITAGIKIDRFQLEIRRLPVEPATAGMGYGFYYGFIQPYIPDDMRIIYDPLGKYKESNYFDVALKLYLYRLLTALVIFFLAVPKIETYKLIRSLKK